MEKRLGKDSIHKILKYVCVALFGGVYFFLIGEFGPIITRDSYVFIDNLYRASNGYVIYHFFLEICRFIWGDEFFLVAAVILQGIMGIATCLLVAEWVSRKYKVNTIEYIIIFILACSTYGFSLMEAVSSHYIMTESISFPLFYVFFILLLAYRLKEGRDKYIYGFFSMLMSIILMFTRSQLAIVPVSVILLLVWDIIWNKNANHKYQIVISIVLICIMPFAIRYPAVNLIRDGAMPPQFLDALGGRALLLADAEDRNYLEGETQQIYDYVYAKVKEGGHLEENLRKNSWRGYDIGVHTNENVKLFAPAVKEYYYVNYGEDVFENSNKADEQYDNRFMIIATLLNEHWMEYIIMSGDLIIQSLVAASFIQPDAYHELFYILCGLMYLAYFFTYFYARKRKIDRAMLDISHMTIYVMLINIITTNLFFYGQQRYVVYTFGFFYISWLLLVIGIYRGKRDGHKA